MYIAPKETSALVYFENLGVCGVLVHAFGAFQISMRNCNMSTATAEEDVTTAVLIGYCDIYILAPINTEQK